MDPGLRHHTVELRNDTGWARGLCTQRRADVERVYPEQTIIGFDQLLQSESARDSGGLRFEVVLRSDRVSYAFPIALEFSERFDADGYYCSSDSLMGPHAGALTAEQRTQWRDGGFLILRSFLDPRRADAVNEFVDRLWSSRANLTEPITIDAYDGTRQEGRSPGRRFLFKDVPARARQTPYKLNDLFLEYDEIRDICLDEQLVPILRALLDGDPVAFNSLYFEYGSEQQDHFDTFFMPPLVRDRMVVTWIALDNVDEHCGPLRYYPGSHLIDPYVFADGRYNLSLAEADKCDRYVATELARRRIEPKILLASKGDVFIWHAQLLHGGTRIDNPDLRRRSLITHYYRSAEFSGADLHAHGPGRYYLNRPHPPPQTLPSGAVPL